MKRLLMDLVVLISFLFLPWFFSAVFSLIGLILYNKYYEIIFWGIVADVIFKTHLFGFFPAQFFLLSVFLLIFQKFLHERIFRKII